MSALMRKQSKGGLEAQHISRILARIGEDRPYWKLLDVGSSVLSQGEELIQKTRMRTLDAVHVALLVTFQAASGFRSPFVTADLRQREAATQLGLDVIWVA